MIITAGATNKSVYYYIVQDAGATSPGEPVTGLIFSDIETGGSASYMRQGAARVDLTLITQTVAGAHSDGGFVEVDATNMKGVYRCDYPDAAWVTGVDQTILSIVVASSNNAVAAPIMVDITDVDLRDAVRGGMTALPNANADEAGGLATSAGGSTGIDDLATSTALATVDGNVDSILTDTAAMQPLVAKIPLSDGVITWNATALASINTQCDTAITDASLATAAALATVDGNVDLILADTAAMQPLVAKIPLSDGSITWNSTALASINAEVDTALRTTTDVEITGVIAATSSITDKIGFLFALARNKGTQTSTTKTLLADNGSTVIATSTVSDDGTTFTRGEYI